MIGDTSVLTTEFQLQCFDAEHREWFPRGGKTTEEIARIILSNARNEDRRKRKQQWRIVRVETVETVVVECVGPEPKGT